MNIMHIPDSEFITLWIRTRSTKDKLIFKTSHMKIGWIATWRRKIKTHSLSLILIALNIKLILSDFDANPWKYTHCNPCLSIQEILSWLLRTVITLLAATKDGARANFLKVCQDNISDNKFSDVISINDFIIAVDAKRNNATRRKQVRHN